MLQGVLHELGEHHDQRRGELGGQDPECTLPPHHHTTLLPRNLGDHGEHLVHDLVNVHPFVERHRQRVVHHGDGGHPAHRFLQRLPRFDICGAAGLQTQQRSHCLQVVLHPVVYLSDGGVLGQQCAIPTAQLGHVADQHQCPGRRCARAQGQRTEQHRGTGCLGFDPGARAALDRAEDALRDFRAIERVRDQGAGQRG